MTDAPCVRAAAAMARHVPSSDSTYGVDQDAAQPLLRPPRHSHRLHPQTNGEVGVQQGLRVHEIISRVARATECRCGSRLADLADARGDGHVVRIVGAKPGVA
jgi:hypothetical protein